MKLRRAASLWLAAGLLAGLAAASQVHAARLALVVGNDSYASIPKLRNARNDARTVATELEAAGFKVTRVLDGTRKTLNDGFDGFLRGVSKGDEVVFYFSGHGSQPPQAGPFLLPIDIEVQNERSILRDGLSLEQVVDDLGRRARFSLIIVDACRDDPFRQTVAGRSLQRGTNLSRIEPPKGTMVIMAASKGQQALDRLSESDPVANGLFTRELVRQMKQKGVSASEMLKRVRTSVERAALTVKHEQRPALVDESSSDFFFYPGSGAAAATAPSPADRDEPVAAPAPVAATYPPQREFDAWAQAAGTATREAFETYLRQYPNGRYAAHARARIATLGGVAPAPAPTPFQKPSGR